MNDEPTRAQLADLAAQLGISGEKMSLIRRGTNWVYDIAGAHVMRVSNKFSPTRVRRNLETAIFASKCAPVLAPESEVVAVSKSGRNTLSATLWPLGSAIEGTSAGEGLGAALKALHGVSHSDSGIRYADPDDLPNRGFERLAKAPDWVDESIVSCLESLLEKRTRAWHKAFSSAPKSVAHNDAQLSNVISYGGEVVLIDLDGSTIGPSFYDLVPEAVARKRMGTIGTYQSVVSGYGDVSKHDEYIQAGIDMREVTSTTWLMTVDTPRHQEEFFKRFETLVDPGDDREWAAF